MKKKLEAELMSIAHRILKLKGKDDLNKMHQEVAALYEKLTVLKFAKENFEEDIPTIGNDSSFFDMLDVAFNNKVSDTIEFEDRTYINLDDSEHEDIMEPAIEKIKDMVAQMPHEAQLVDSMVEKATSKTKVHKINLDDITAGFDNEPIFDPVKKGNPNLKKSLNDQLKKGIVIGLNDKIAFIKHLFDGEADDYNRVISQINTLNSVDEVRNLIFNIVKPDYNNWEGKEDYETRFMELIESKFD
ncbi:MAG: hypothetical protein CMC55_02585 [Flavobacteriaceae bacterium]|uniref:hypothetical protein n=1 Tax=Bizionia echini TaxID=649333 RepID=UPI000C992FCB|nr:hypothetical protein [Flavobacteriaceae bacterium]|tara:strand:- start:145 stop:876 length:732 start_codon:yes stop_codon:yes gene_type:complete